MRRPLRRWPPALFVGVLVSLLAIGSVYAAPISDVGSFSATETIITFNEMPDGTPMLDGTPITTQFSGLGVTFTTLPGKEFTARTAPFGRIWPGSGVPVAINFESGVTPVTAVFDPPVSRVGFDVYSNPGDSVELQAFLNGAFVEAHVFNTGIIFAPFVTFVGLEVPGGFDTLVIAATGGRVVIPSAWTIFVLKAPPTNHQRPSLRSNRSTLRKTRAHSGLWLMAQT